MAAPAGTHSLRSCFVKPFDKGLTFYPFQFLSTDNPSESSATVGDVNPPAFAHKILVRVWNRISELFITGLPGAQEQQLEGEVLYRHENVARHNSEADVVRTAAMYVLHPINQALNSHPDTRGFVTCLAESSLNRLRADITYFKTPSTGGDRRAFAVVEFKKRQLIKSSQFTEAEKMLSNITENQVIANSNQISGRTQANNSATYYKHYSLKLMKQASAYAILHRTKYVALFDWDVLVLVRFQPMQLLKNGRLRESEDIAVDGVGDWCQTTVVTQSAHIRPALLGFLYEAFIATPY